MGLHSSSIRVHRLSSSSPDERVPMRTRSRTVGPSSRRTPHRRYCTAEGGSISQMRRRRHGKAPFQSITPLRMSSVRTRLMSFESGAPSKSTIRAMPRCCTAGSSVTCSMMNMLNFWYSSTEHTAGSIRDMFNTTQPAGPASCRCLLPLQTKSGAREGLLAGGSSQWTPVRPAASTACARIRNGQRAARRNFRKPSIVFLAWPTSFWWYMRHLAKNSSAGNASPGCWRSVREQRSFRSSSGETSSKPSREMSLASSSSPSGLKAVLRKWETSTREGLPAADILSRETKDHAADRANDAGRPRP
mmetsp:Transcript_57290/g.185561  ORF Transcript_57290/g.185561 Transcript_57290/m.185561 type:complete len:303 (+) Transcript_57290:171-1079(+)